MRNWGRRKEGGQREDDGGEILRQGGRERDLTRAGEIKDLRQRGKRETQQEERQ